MKYLFIGLCMSFTLSFYGDLPVEDNYGIPRKIWQTYRTKELPRPAAQARDSWLKENPHYEYCFMDDLEIEEYVLNCWNSDYYECFKSLPLGVMKADLWRYLIITDKGGVYTDIDSICSLPIDYWIDFLGGIHKIEGRKPLLFVGVENEIGLCQWTIMATPKHPAMKFICEYIFNHWKDKGVDLSKRNFVHLTTGPTIWKSAILKYLDEPESLKTSILWNKYLSDKAYKKKVNDLGIYLLSDQFYSGFAVIHLNGSTQFEEGYVSWQKESLLYRLRSTSEND